MPQNADAILVHHGYFWRGEDARVIGQKHRRLKRLLVEDINLFAYHLPLDMHPEWGNNAQLARQLGLTAQARFGESNLGWLGVAADPALRTVGDLAHRVEARLGRMPLLIGDPAQPLASIGWCTGAAQDLLGAAIDGRRQRLPERRNLGADSASGARIGRRLSGLRPSRDRTLWRAGVGRASGAAFRAAAPFYRYPQSGLRAVPRCGAGNRKGACGPLRAGRRPRKFNAEVADNLKHL